MENIPARRERAGRLCRISSVISSITAKRARPVGRALCLRFAKEPFLQVLLVALDHFLDHLAADRAGLAGGQIAVVAPLEVDANLAGGFHLELVHGRAGLGNVELIGILAGHNEILLLFGS